MTDYLLADKTAAERQRRKDLKERFSRATAEGLRNDEVLELILGYAIQKGDVKAVSSRLIERFGGLRGVFEASHEELMAVAGIGETTAVLIRLVKGVSKAFLKDRIIGKDAIRCTRDVLDYLDMTLSGERIEKFLAIYLNARNEVLAVEVLHEGTINQTAVYPRKAIELAFRHNASAIIFVHNHPSGDPTPSGMDRQLTRVLDRAASAVDLIVHDHIVIGRNRHVSMRERGWIGCHNALGQHVRLLSASEPD